MNDPDQTLRLPVVEFSSESNGASSHTVVPPQHAAIPGDPAIAPDAVVPLPGTAIDHPAIDARAGRPRPEPTLFGAIRQYPLLVVGVAVLGLVIAAVYAFVQPSSYRAEANVTVPLPASLPAATADPGQYLDSQVLLLESQGVAQQAANIANGTLGGSALNAGDFSTTSGGLKVEPPAGANPGGYGASIVTVSFTAPNATTAQAGLNAVLQAFDDAVFAAIKSQANATIAGIDQAIGQSTSAAQQATLEGQRTQTLVNEQADLARPPTAAVQPATKVSGHTARYAILGLVAGLVVGSALAFVLASRRRTAAVRRDQRWHSAWS